MSKNRVLLGLHILRTKTKYEYDLHKLVHARSSRRARVRVSLKNMASLFCYVPLRV